MMSVSFFRSPLVQRFIASRPMATAAQAIARRLLHPSQIDQLFRDNAKLQFEKTLLFSSVTHLMMTVTFGENKSINAAYKKMFEKIDVTVESVYNKLRRIEPGTSRALVRYAYQASVDINREMGGVQRSLLSGYTVRILDGNWLAGTEHRIKETRFLMGSPLPGKSLVVYDPRFDSVSDYFPIEDGYAQELSVIDQVIETFSPNELWIADRNFCTLKAMYGCSMAKAFFLIRQHGKLRGTVQGKLKRIGKSDSAEIFENKLVLPSYEGQTLVVRRIVCKLFKPTQDGETEVVLLTNLPEKDADGVKISELYRRRWKIENVFLHLTNCLNCEINTLCYPPAALFCFALSLVAYNSLAILKAIVTKVHGREETEMLSHYYVAAEIGSTTDGMLIAIPEEDWGCLATTPLKTFVEQLVKIGEHIDMRRYRKTIRGPKKPQPKRKGNQRSTHLSTKRILEKRQ